MESTLISAECIMQVEPATGCASRGYLIYGTMFTLYESSVCPPLALKCLLLNATYCERSSWQDAQNTTSVASVAT